MSIGGNNSCPKAILNGKKMSQALLNHRPPLSGASDRTGRGRAVTARGRQLSGGTFSGPAPDRRTPSQPVTFDARPGHPAGSLCAASPQPAARASPFTGNSHDTLPFHTQNESAPLRGRSVGVNAQQRQEPAGAGGEQSARAGAWSQTLRAGGVCRLQGGGQAVRAPGAGGGRVRICAAARVLPAQGSLPGGPGVQGLGLPCCGTVRPRPAGDGRSSRYPESKAARAGRKGRRPCGASVPRTPPRFRRARDSAPTPSTEQGLAPCSPARRCPSQPAPPTSSPPHTLPALGAHRIKSPGGWGFHPHQRQPRRVTLTWP